MSVPASGVSSKLSQGPSLNRTRTSNYEVYKEFKEFSVKQLREFEQIFNRFCHQSTHKMGLQELKAMMEKLGCAQTHLGLKEIMKELDENNDGDIDFKEFLQLFRNLKSGGLDGRCADDGLLQLAKTISVDVTDVGVGGAKQFFEAKIKEVNCTNKFEEEIKKEQEEKKRENEEKKKRLDEFKKKQAVFNSP